MSMLKMKPELNDTTTQDAVLNEILVMETDDEKLSALRKSIADNQAKVGEILLKRKEYTTTAREQVLAKQLSAVRSRLEEMRNLLRVVFGASVPPFARVIRERVEAALVADGWALTTVNPAQDRFTWSKHNHSLCGAGAFQLVDLCLGEFGPDWVATAIKMQGGK